MTVEKLRELLAGYPPNMPVVVEGYEGGYEDVEEKRVFVTQLRRDFYDKEVMWFYGPHNKVEDWDGEDEEKIPAVTHLLLAR